MFIYYLSACVEIKRWWTAVRWKPTRRRAWRCSDGGWTQGVRRKPPRCADC